jgi:hypothetical protein
MRSFLCLFLVAAIWMIICNGDGTGSNRDQNKTNTQNQTESPDEQDPYQESVEEFPGPFMIKRLPYRIIEDESEPDYFGILGVPRSSSLARIRSSFRKSSRDYRDILMYFRSPPNYSRMNLTKSTKEGAKTSRTRPLPLSHLRPKLVINETLSAFNTSNDSTTNENVSSVEDMAKAAEKAARAARMKALDKQKRLEEFKSMSEAYRILTNPRSLARTRRPLLSPDAWFGFNLKRNTVQPSASPFETRGVCVRGGEVGDAQRDALSCLST